MPREGDIWETQQGTRWCVGRNNS